MNAEALGQASLTRQLAVIVLGGIKRIVGVRDVMGQRCCILPDVVPLLRLQTIGEFEAVFADLPGQVAVAADAPFAVARGGSLVRVRQVQIREVPVLV